MCSGMGAAKAGWRHARSSGTQLSGNTQCMVVWVLQRLSGDMLG